MNYIICGLLAAMSVGSVLSPAPSSQILATAWVPDIARLASVKAFVAQPIKFEQFVFYGDDFPKFDFADPATVKRLIGPYELKATFYDAGGREAAAPKALGRYAAMVEVKYAQRTTRRFVTLCRTDLRSKPQEGLGGRAAFQNDTNIDRRVLEDRAAELGPAEVDSLGGVPLPGAVQAVLSAGLYDLSALKAARKQLPTDSLRTLDRQWWVTFKRHYYGYDKLYPNPFVCPAEFKGKAAAFVHKGQLSEAGIKEAAVEAIDRAAEVWVKESGIGFNLCVVRHGVIVVNTGYGTKASGPQKDERYTSETAGPLASTTKFLSGILFAEFADQGLIDFDQSPGKYVSILNGPALPRVPTLRDMYIHIAGLSGHWGDLLPDTEERLADLFPHLQVGAKHEYEGVSLALGGKIMEMISGECIPRLYQKHLFGPLGCTGTQAELTSYGSMSTALDLARIGQMMVNGGRYGTKQFLSRRTIEKMMPIPGRDRYDPDKTVRWGIGIKQFDIDGLSERAYGHPGASGSFVVVDPARDLVIAMTRYEEGGAFKDFLQKKGVFIKTILDQIQ